MSYLSVFLLGHNNIKKMLMMQECCKLFTGLFHLLLRKRYAISYCHTGNVTRMSWRKCYSYELAAVL